MSMGAEYVARIFLRGEISQFVSSMAEAGAAAKGAASAMESPGAAVAKFGESVSRTSILVGGLGVALGGAAVLAAGKFDQMIAQTAGNTTLSGQAVNQLRSEVLKLGNEGPAKLDDIAKGFMRVTNEGYKGIDANRILEASWRAAIAAGSEVQPVANALATTMRVFHVNTRDAGQTMLQLHLIAANGNMTLQQWASSLSQAGPTAYIAGLSLKEYGSTIDVLTQHGFTAAKAQTQLAQLLFQMLNPTAVAEKGIQAVSKATGVDLVHDLSYAGLHVKGFTKILEDLSKATGNRPDILGEMFKSKQGLKALEAILPHLSEYNKLLHENTITTQNAGLIQEQFGRVMSSFGAQLDTARNKAQILAITLGEVLIPHLQGQLRAITGTFPAIETFITHHKNLAVGAMDVSEKLLLAGLGYKAIATVAGLAFSPILALRGVMVALGATMGLSAAASTGIGLALIAAGVGGKYAYDHNKPFHDLMLHFPDAFEGVTHKVTENTSAHRTNVEAVTHTQGAWERLKGAASSLGSELVHVTTETDKHGQASNVVTEIIKRHADALGNLGTALFGTEKTITTTTTSLDAYGKKHQQVVVHIEAHKGAIAQLGDSMAATGHNVDELGPKFEAWRGHVGNALESAGAASDRFGKSLGESMGQAGNHIGTFAQTSLTHLSGWSANMGLHGHLGGLKFSDGLRNAGPAALDAAQSLGNGILRGLGNLAGELGDKGHQAAIGLAHAIESGNNAVNAAAKSLVAAALQGLSNLATELGVAAKAGGAAFAHGLGSAVGAVTSAALSLVNAAAGALGSLVGRAAAFGANAGAAFASGLGSMIGSVASAAESLVGAAVGHLGFHSPNKYGIDFEKFGRNAGKAFAKGLSDTAGDVGAAAQLVLNSALSVLGKVSALGQLSATNRIANTFGDAQSVAGGMPNQILSLLQAIQQLPESIAAPLRDSLLKAANDYNNINDKFVASMQREHDRHLNNLSKENTKHEQNLSKNETTHAQKLADIHSSHEEAIRHLLADHRIKHAAQLDQFLASNAKTYALAKETLNQHVGHLTAIHGKYETTFRDHAGQLHTIMHYHTTYIRTTLQSHSDAMTKASIIVQAAAQKFGISSKEAAALMDEALKHGGVLTAEQIKKEHDRFINTQKTENDRHTAALKAEHIRHENAIHTIQGAFINGINKLHSTLQSIANGTANVTPAQLWDAIGQQISGAIDTGYKSLAYALLYGKDTSTTTPVALTPAQKRQNALDRANGAPDTFASSTTTTTTVQSQIDTLLNGIVQMQQATIGMGLIMDAAHLKVFTLTGDLADFSATVQSANGYYRSVIFKDALDGHALNQTVFDQLLKNNDALQLATDAQTGLTLLEQTAAGNLGGMSSAIKTLTDSNIVKWQGALMAGAGVQNQYTASVIAGIQAEKAVTVATNYQNEVLGRLSGNWSMMASGLNGVFTQAEDGVTGFTMMLGRAGSSDGIGALTSAALDAAQNLGSLDDMIKGFGSVVSSISNAAGTEIARNGSISADTINSYKNATVKLDGATADRIQADLTLAHSTNDLVGYQKALGEEIALEEKRVISIGVQYGTSSQQYKDAMATLKQLDKEYEGIGYAIDALKGKAGMTTAQLTQANWALGQFTSGNDIATTNIKNLSLILPPTSDGVKELGESSTTAAKDTNDLGTAAIAATGGLKSFASGLAGDLQQIGTAIMQAAGAFASAARTVTAAANDAAKASKTKTLTGAPGGAGSLIGPNGELLTNVTTVGGTNESGGTTASGFPSPNGGITVSGLVQNVQDNAQLSNALGSGSSSTATTTTSSTTTSSTTTTTSVFDQFTNANGIGPNYNAQQFYTANGNSWGTGFLGIDDNGNPVYSAPNGYTRTTRFDIPYDPAGNSAPGLSAGGGGASFTPSSGTTPPSTTTISGGFFDGFVGTNPTDKITTTGLGSVLRHLGIHGSTNTALLDELKKLREETSKLQKPAQQTADNTTKVANNMMTDVQAAEMIALLRDNKDLQAQLKAAGNAIGSTLPFDTWFDELGFHSLGNLGAP